MSNNYKKSSSSLFGDLLDVAGAVIGGAYEAGKREEEEAKKAEAKALRKRLEELEGPTNETNIDDEILKVKLQMADLGIGDFDARQRLRRKLAVLESERQRRSWKR